MRILVADDDRVSCRLLEKLLHKWGYAVIAAHSGTEAWNALQAEDGPRSGKRTRLDDAKNRQPGDLPPRMRAIEPVLRLHHPAYSE